ncbi:molybdopterin molybdotransferase MoeA [Pareuzebyella sediminis]|uniref:molybdopterin molybdotransferase MoeA n=1 Tax=Pareuzebyella sediminis TaxID=2607998 RepID=UPI0011EC0402|nr:molybdopterin molybdotransferase MoeA [Pareuzebyella sediminis]
MISFEDAYNQVLEHTIDFGTESVPVLESVGRILAEEIKADRDFPPFDRSTKDGIAIRFSAIEKGIREFKIEGVLSAGMAQQTLSSETNCFEIMTGAVLPKEADTIIMYEQTKIKGNRVHLLNEPLKGQNIHARGSDEKKGNVLLGKDVCITPTTIGVLASVGKVTVKVKKLPRICVVSTGNELVDIAEIPLAHQIRKSNSFSLAAALIQLNIYPTFLHMADSRELIVQELKNVLDGHDVLMLSGGVSKGKFDFIPEALDTLGIKKIFHRVAQRPGKPFWFGVQEERRKIVFSFPGNPVSTFANYLIYFLPWLAKCHSVSRKEQSLILDEPVNPHASLTLFVQVKISWEEGRLHGLLVKGNGSGDLVGLAKADGFIRIPQGTTEISKGSVFPFIPIS